jgi:hypothetical protein
LTPCLDRRRIKVVFFTVYSNMIDIKLMGELKIVLKQFNDYFAYLHGKSEAIDLLMPDAAVMVWLRVYSELTSEERRLAIEATYEKEKFHPTPEKFRELVRGTDDAEAINEWIVILDAIRMSLEDSLNRILCLSPIARQALRTVGGIYGLRECSEMSLHRSVKEDFCRAYKLIKHSTNNIPHPLEQIAPTIAPKSQAGVRDASKEIASFVTSFSGGAR